MSEPLSVRVDASRVNLKFEAMPEELRTAVLQAVLELGGPLADLARGRAEELLHTRRGRFVKSIRFSLKRNRNRVEGRVSSSAKTANLFEWGGKTGAHEILPDKAKALRLPGGKFVARVHHPGGQYKRLEIIHGAFAEMASKIRDDLERAVNEVAARDRL